MQIFSIWEKESFLSTQDIIIVGSGFAGLWSALYLKLLHPGNKITILERALLPGGASTRNAGFSCFGSPSELIDDANDIGTDKMWNLVEMRYRGLQIIQQYFSAAAIDFEYSGGFECFTPGSPEYTTCLNKLNWLNEGLKDITGTAEVFTNADDKIPLFGLHGFNHLLGNKLEGCLHPGKLTRELVKKITGLGVQLITGLEVLKYEDNQKEVLVFTNQTEPLHTKQLLVCTNAFSPQLVPGFDNIPNRGQVLITAPIKNLLLKGSFHYDKGFYYFRNVGNRLLIGGARNKDMEAENTLEMITTDTIQQELKKFIQLHLVPGTEFTVTDQWAGIMGMGKDKSPIVSAISKNVFCCLRLSGMGVALAPVLAQQVTQLMNE